ncbi:hypothetical protein EGW08_005471 [Elysia chlorotica]|uniref:GAF domain-containing protein n=1 Tax=Elysia chlorotica TaxID=188477 RepID=A0A433TZ18_ELYCH|nr:hypothetical protein EGW08_005471 [Elysia chlorotica]
MGVETQPFRHTVECFTRFKYCLIVIGTRDFSVACRTLYSTSSDPSRSSPALRTSGGIPTLPISTSPSTKLEPSRGQVSGDTSSSSSECSRGSSPTIGSSAQEDSAADDITTACVQQSSTSAKVPGSSSRKSSDACAVRSRKTSVVTSVYGDPVESCGKSSKSSSVCGKVLSGGEVSSTRNKDTDDAGGDTKITYTLPTPPIDTATNGKASAGSFDYSTRTFTTSKQQSLQTSPHQEFSASGIGGVSGLGAGFPYPGLHARAAVSGRSLRSRALLSRGGNYAVRKMSVAGGPGGFHHQGGSDIGGGAGGLGGSIDLKDEDARQEFDTMERWLDEHPEFVHDYFARKAHKSMVDGWLLAHALAGAENLSTSSASSKASSGANTPVRKISAQDFERGGILNPIVSTVDGLPTFLGPSCSSTPTPTSKCRRRSKSELKALDEKELMYELVIDICNDLDVTSLCYKILQNLCILLNADRCSLFLVKGTSSKYLASKLFDVTSDSEFETVCDREDEIRIPLGTGIAGYVAKTGEVVNIPDAYELREHVSLGKETPPPIQKHRLFQMRRIPDSLGK